MDVGKAHMEMLVKGLGLGAVHMLLFLIFITVTFISGQRLLYFKTGNMHFNY